MNDIETRWTKIAADQLLNRRIVKVRYMTEAEAHEMEWNWRGIVLQLDDGTLIFPSEDDEGNGPGALFTNNEDNPVIPVI